MAWIRQVEHAESNGLLRKIFDDAVKRAGRIWNILRIQSINARQLRASMAIYTSVMKTDSALTPRLRETLAVVVSEANHCHY